MSLLPFVHVDVRLHERCAGDRIPVSDAEVHHLRRVLRLDEGATVHVSDGRGGLAEARLGADALELSVDAISVPAPVPAIAIAQAVGKGRKVDEVVRTVTELGADAISVVAAARSVAHVAPEKAARLRTRWTALVRAACEQSRRPHRPSVEGPVATGDLTGAAGGLIVAHPDGEPLPAVVRDLADEERITIAVGPEGGWTDAEVDRLTRAGARLAGLGPLILRTEHAAAAAVAVSSAELGRWAAGTTTHVPPRR